MRGCPGWCTQPLSIPLPGPAPTGSGPWLSFAHESATASDTRNASARAPDAAARSPGSRPDRARPHRPAGIPGGAGRRAHAVGGAARHRQERAGAPAAPGFRRGPLLRAPAHPLHGAGGAVRPAVDLGPGTGPLRAHDRGLPAAGHHRLHRRGVQGQQRHPQCAAHAAQRTRIRQRRGPRALPARQRDRRDQRGAGRRSGGGFLRPVPDAPAGGAGVGVGLSRPAGTRWTARCRPCRMR